MTPTNPFVIAWAALTAPNAIAYYAMRAQQDTGLVIWAVATAATAAYALGADVADALRVSVINAQPRPAEPLALPEADPIVIVANMAMTAWAIAREAVEVLEAEIVEPLALAPAGCAGYLPAASEPTVTRKARKEGAALLRSTLAGCTVAQLRQRCEDAGLPSGGRKPQLISRLVDAVWG
ncbi:MAG: SAP domain-containing protein [Aeromonas sp.]